jgi:peptidylprolyl isomerase
MNWRALASVASLALLACNNNASSDNNNDNKTKTSASASASAKKQVSPLGDIPTAALTAPDNAPAQAGAIPAPPDVGAAPADAVKTASGLATKVLKPGTGKDKPGPDDVVKAHYTGWKKDGTMFDSSIPRNEPLVFGVREVIPGWTEAIQLMVVGEKRRVWIPSALAYGDPPKRPGAPAGDLVFDVELLDIIHPPKAPPDVKAPPADAKKTASGLAYKVLKSGPAGGKSPVPSDRVTVHYSGWTTDGKMFDSSVMRNEPAHFGVGGVIKGWTEGLQLMKPGDKFRFWIPSDLAYGDKPRGGAPAGMLVFDVELISVP